MKVVATRRSIANNALAGWLVARLDATPTGCRLAGRIRPNRFASTFLILWSVFAVLAAATMIVDAITGGDPAGLLALILPTAAVAFILGGGSMGESDRREIRAQVSDALRCEPDDSATIRAPISAVPTSTAPTDSIIGDGRPRRVARPGPYTSPPPTPEGPTT